MAHQLKHLVVCGLLSLTFFKVQAQGSGNKNFKPAAGVSINASTTNVIVTWPAGSNSSGRLILNLKNDQPLFSSIQLGKGGIYKPVIENVDPQFILTEGKRDLISQNGWNIFFDKVPLKPHHSYKIDFHKKGISVSNKGSRTIILSLIHI